MATKVVQSTNGSQSSGKGRRSERRARRERCRTQVYEGQYKTEHQQPMDDAPSSDQSNRPFRPRHKSCDSKVDLKSKRRSLPSGTEDFIGSASDSPEEDLRKWARRPRRSRADGTTRNSGSGQSSGSQRGSITGSQKGLTVPTNPLATQPSSDSALYARQKGGTYANSSNGSKSKFQRLEERRRQRIEMTVTSDEEALNDSGSALQSWQQPTSRPKVPKPVTNGKTDYTVIAQPPQIAYAHSFNPAGYRNDVPTSYANSSALGNSQLSQAQNVQESADEVLVKRPVSLLKAQFEKQMQPSPSVINGSKVAVNSSGPVIKASIPNTSEPRRLPATSVSVTTTSVTVQSYRQAKSQSQTPLMYSQPAEVAPAVSRSFKPSPPHLSIAVGQTSQRTKDHNFNDADSLDELLEANKDYLLSPRIPVEKSADKPSIKQTVKTVEHAVQSKPNRELGTSFANVSSQRRTSDPKAQKKTIVEVPQSSINQIPQSPKTVSAPIWPRNILTNLSPKCVSQANVSAANVNQGNVFNFVQNPSSVQRTPVSPGSDTLEDLWIPRRVEPHESTSGTSVKLSAPLQLAAPKKPEKTFVRKTPVMVVTEAPKPPIQKQPSQEPFVTQSQNVNPEGLPVPPGPDGMFSDVEYNIEVSERVKKWEFLMHEKNKPSRKSQTPDKVNLVEDDGSGDPLSPRLRPFAAARLSVIDEKSEAKNMFGYPSRIGTGYSAGGVVTNSGGDLMLSHNQMWTYPGNSPKPSPPKGRVGPHESVRHERQDTLFGDEPWVSDWYFKGHAKKGVEQSDQEKESEPIEFRALETPKNRWNTASYGSSPTMTRKIVYEQVGTEGATRLNPFFGPSSDSEITNPLYAPITPMINSNVSAKKAGSLKAGRPSQLTVKPEHRRQDSDEQIWKEIERMTVYARAIAGTASATSQSRSETQPLSHFQKSPTRRSAYEPLTSQNPATSSDPFVPLSVDVTSPRKTGRSRFNNPLENIPTVVSANVYKPSRPAKTKTTKSIQYEHVPVTDKYQRPEALDEVLEEITTSLEKKPFSPKNKSPGFSSSSQWSTGTPDKPPLSPDAVALASSQRTYAANDPIGGRPSSLAFPPNQNLFVPQQTREQERRASDKQQKFINLAHGKEYQLDHNLLKQKLLNTGLVESPIIDDGQHTDTGSCRTLDSDSGSQQSLTHINNAIKELRQLARDVESKIDMIKTRLVTTKEEDLDKVLMTLRRCSSNLASAKSGYVSSSAAAKTRKTKLNDALSELERIYQSLELSGDTLGDRVTRHDYPQLLESQWSIPSITDVSSLGSYPHSGSEVYTDTNLSDYNSYRWQTSGLGRKEMSHSAYSTDGLEMLTKALEGTKNVADSSCDSWSGDHRVQDGEDTPRAYSHTAYPFHKDDMAQRRFTQNTARSVGIDPHTPTESLSALSSEESSRRTRSRKQEVDLTDDASYRKIRTKSATRQDADSPNMSPATSSDYLTKRSRSEARSRMRIRPEREPDVMHDDMAYRNLRKDVIIENPKPPPRSSSLHRKGKKSDEGSDSDGRQLCNAETQTYSIDDGDSTGAENDTGRREKSRQGRSKEKSFSGRKHSRQDQRRRRSLGRGVAKMVERFSSSEDERQQKRPLKHSLSAPDLSEQAIYSATYNERGEIISTETDTNKEDDVPTILSRKKGENAVQNQNGTTSHKSLGSKSQTPRTVKQRNEAKGRVRVTQPGKWEAKNGAHDKVFNGRANAENKPLVKAKATEKFSSSDQTPIGSSCEGSPAPARLLIHRRTKRVPLATISTTSTSGEDSASGSRNSLNQTMSLPQGSIIKRQTPADLPKGTGVKIRNKDSAVSKEDREERSKSVPELCARFETDPARLKAILGTLRKSISAMEDVPMEAINKQSFCSEPNLKDCHFKGKIINKETLLLNWNLDEDTEKEIFC